MAFWNKIFKKERKSVEHARNDVKKQAEKPADKKAPAKESRIIAGVIRSPRITEKTSGLAKENKYVFTVSPRANKIGVKSAIEARYGVNVEAVNIVNVREKERRRGRQIGWKPGFKKAIVKVKEGQTIETQ